MMGDARLPLWLWLWRSGSLDKVGVHASELQYECKSMCRLIVYIRLSEDDEMYKFV